MSEPIAICVLINENEFETIFCIENLIAKTNIPFELHIYFFKEYTEYLEQLTKSCFVNKNLKSIHTVNCVGKTLSFAYNDFLTNCKSTYGVFFPSNCIVNENWLSELKQNYSQIKNSGCISIKKTSENLKLTSVLYENVLHNEEQMKTVYFTEHQSFNDFCFFSLDNARNIGNLTNDRLLNGVELKLWSFSFFSNGLINYFIKYNNVIQLKTEDSVLYPKITKQTAEKFKLYANKLLTVNKYEKE
jgi:hypothetical protein